MLEWVAGADEESSLAESEFLSAIDLSQFEAWEPVFSEEELKKAEQSTEWFSTTEVLSHLEKH